MADDVFGDVGRAVGEGFVEGGAGVASEADAAPEVLRQRGSILVGDVSRRVMT